MIIPGGVNNDALCGDINVISDADKEKLSLPGDLHNPGDPDFNKNLTVFSHIQNDFNGGAFRLVMCLANQLILIQTIFLLMQMCVVGIYLTTETLVTI